jgi:hypothetical protein
MHLICLDAARVSFQRSTAILYLYYLQDESKIIPVIGDICASYLNNMYHTKHDDI